MPVVVLLLGVGLLLVVRRVPLLRAWNDRTNAYIDSHRYVHVLLGLTTGAFAFLILGFGLRHYDEHWLRHGFAFAVVMFVAYTATGLTRSAVRRRHAVRP
jgi:hypothetical protein